MTFPFRRISIALFIIIIFLAAFMAGFALLSPIVQVIASPALQQETTPTPPTPTQEVTPTPTPSTCEGCHPEVQKDWYAGAHSAARTDHVLEQAGNCAACHPEMTGDLGMPSGAPIMGQSNDPKGGKNCAACHTTGYDPKTNKSKSYGITCEACHSPIPTEHPDKDAPIYAGADLCARCHSDSRFNWSEWKDSKHYQQYMSCTECHSPHSTSLRFVNTEAPNKSVLCLKCHETTSEMSPYSVHGRAGVTCEQCHLGEKKGPDTFHVVPNHSFEVQIETCRKCHADEMHRAKQPGEEVPAALNINPSATPYAAQNMEEEKSSGGNSTNIILVAALMSLVGLLAGVIFSSRLKKLLQK